MPPAEQGDVDFARFGLGADVILLIDGVHRQRLPVWHKDTLTLPKAEGNWQETASIHQFARSRTSVL